MSKVYVIMHRFLTDGGFGDAIYGEQIVFITPNKEKALEYVEKWNDPHVYDSPYADLECGELVVDEWNLVDDPDTAVDPFDHDNCWSISAYYPCDHTTLSVEVAE